MAIAIFIGISEHDAKLFRASKGKLVPHGDGAYLLKEIHRITSPSFAIRNSTASEQRFVAELRPCATDPAQPSAAPAVQQRIELAFDQNEFTMREI